MEAVEEAVEEVCVEAETEAMVAVAAKVGAPEAVVKRAALREAAVVEMVGWMAVATRVKVEAARAARAEG